MNLTIADASTVGLIEFGVITTDGESGAVGIIESNTGSCEVAVVAGSSVSASGTLTGFTGEITLHLSVTTTEISLDIGGTPVSATIPGDVESALAALTVYPFAIIYPASGSSLISTDWEYDTGGAPPPPAAVGSPRARQPDFVDRHIVLKRRIKNFQIGVTPVHFYYGMHGYNTLWERLTPMAGWSFSDGDAYCQIRVRSDQVYLQTVGGSLILVGSDDSEPSWVEGDTPIPLFTFAEEAYQPAQPQNCADGGLLFFVGEGVVSVLNLDPAPFTLNLNWPSG
jgi:hypothetical protein